MKHIVIGTLFGLLVILLGGCKSIVESNPAIFGEWIGKPVVGEGAEWSNAVFKGRTSGDMREFNRIAGYRFRDKIGCLPNGWSSKSTTLDWEFNPRHTGRFYSYHGRIYMIPAKGTSAYKDYEWRMKQK